LKDQRSQSSTSQSQKQLPSRKQQALRYARSRFRKVWDVRGGGLYAVGYILSFLFFEARTVVEEISESTGLGDFLRDQLLGFVLRFATDSLANMVRALIWPAYVVDLYPRYGIIALVIAFIAFPKYLKKPIEKALFDE